MIRRVSLHKYGFVFCEGDGDHRYLHVLTRSFPTRRSTELAGWGLQQFGIQAVIASSLAEIFHANAMNNRLLLVVLSEAQVQAIMADASQSSTRSEEHTSELQSLMPYSYAGFCLSKETSY